MLRRITLDARALPLELKFTNIRAYVIIAAFAALSVLTPWTFHQFQLAGATFLPMHIFVLGAALAAGWQAGVIVGLLTPLASYAISGQPIAAVLPQLVIEVTAYGLIAGLLRQKLNLGVVPALLGAMVGGRIALLAAVFAVQFITGHIYSPLGPSATPLTAVWNTVAQSWPGIIAQLALIPAAFWAIGRINRKARAE